MKMSHIMSISKILTGFCAIRQGVRIKTLIIKTRKTNIVYNVLKVKEFW